MTLSEDQAKEKAEDFENMQLYMLIAFITVATIALSFLCCICINMQSLKLAIDVIDASADFLNGTKRIILVPIFYFFVTLIFVLVWIGAAGCVISMNKIEVFPLIPQAKTFNFDSEFNFYSFWYMVFGLCWITAWLEYTCKFVIQVTAASYYYNSSPAKGEGSAQVMLGFKFAYMNHMGSIAFGSFIIAVVRFIKIVFLYAAQKFAKASGENVIAKTVVKVGMCVLSCIERVCDYINSSAYAYIAVSGKGFCHSALSAFLLQLKHLTKFAFANLIAKVFIFIGKIAITAANCYSLLMIMTHITKDTEEVSSYLGPFAVVGVFTFFTASIFLGLFDTSVLALLTCLSIDMDCNGD